MHIPATVSFFLTLARTADSYEPSWTNTATKQTNYDTCSAKVSGERKRGTQLESSREVEPRMATLGQEVRN